MRILLDEQLPRQLARRMVGHNVRTVEQESCAGLKNGALLTIAAAAGFSVLVTGDQNLEYRQNLTMRKMGVVVLATSINALEDLVPLQERTLIAIDQVQPGQVLRVTA